MKQVPDCWCHKTNEVSKRGIPDILICFKGKFHGYELKKDEFEKPDPLQQYELEKIKKAGGLVGILHPKNFIKILSDHGILKEK